MKSIKGEDLIQLLFEMKAIRWQEDEIVQGFVLELSELKPYLEGKILVDEKKLREKYCGKHCPFDCETETRCVVKEILGKETT